MVKRAECFRLVIDRADMEFNVIEFVMPSDRFELINVTVLLEKVLAACAENLKAEPDDIAS